MDEKRDDKKLYLVDNSGAVPHELNRFLEVSGYAHRLSEHSGVLGEIIASLRDIASQLGLDRDGGAGREVGYTFASEQTAKEELLRVSGFLRGINYKIWGVSRLISTEAEQLADRIQIEDTQKFDAELADFLKKDLVGVGGKS